MKNIYEKPTVEITEFECKDIITASTGTLENILDINETGINTVDF